MTGRVAAGGDQVKSERAAAFGARASCTRKSIGSSPRWAAVRSTLIIRPWVAAPRQVPSPLTGSP